MKIRIRFRIGYESRKAKKAYKKENKLRHSSIEEQNIISRAVMWIRAASVPHQIERQDPDPRYRDADPQHCSRELKG